MCIILLNFLKKPEAAVAEKRASQTRSSVAPNYVNHKPNANKVSYENVTTDLSLLMVLLYIYTFTYFNPFP